MFYPNTVEDISVGEHPKKMHVFCNFKKNSVDLTLNFDIFAMN